MLPEVDKEVAVYINNLISRVALRLLVMVNVLIRTKTNVCGSPGILGVLKRMAVNAICVAVICMGAW